MLKKFESLQKIECNVPDIFHISTLYFSANFNA